MVARLGVLQHAHRFSHARGSTGCAQLTLLSGPRQQRLADNGGRTGHLAGRKGRVAGGRIGWWWAERGAWRAEGSGGGGQERARGGAKGGGAGRRTRARGGAPG